MLTRISVLLCLGGCSLSLSGPDPNRPATAPPQCDSNKGLVGLDTVVAVAAGVAGLALLSDGNGGAGGGMLLTSALFGGSALRGNARVDRCRGAFRDYDVAMLGEVRQRQGMQPALAAAPPTTEQAPAVAVAPKLRMRPRDAVAAEKPPDGAPAKPPAVEIQHDDAFHVPVGAPAPARPPAKPVVNPGKPTSDDAWRDFWREVL